jgi:hypothetical protein
LEEVEMSNLKDVKAKNVKITLSDGVERELRFTLNAMAELEDKYGSIDAAFKALDSNSMKAVRFVLWAGLLHTDEGLTEQQVGNLIDMQCMQDIVATMSDAFGNDMPEDEQVPNVVQPVQLTSAK